MSNSDVKNVMGHQADGIIDAWVARREGRIGTTHPLIHTEAARDAVDHAEQAGSFVQRLDAEAAREGGTGVAIGGNAPSRDVRAEVRGRMSEDTE